MKPKKIWRERERPPPRKIEQCEKGSFQSDDIRSSSKNMTLKTQENNVIANDLGLFFPVQGSTEWVTYSFSKEKYKAMAQQNLSIFHSYSIELVLQSRIKNAEESHPSIPRTRTEIIGSGWLAPLGG